MIEHKNIYEAINAVMTEVGYVQKQRSDGLKYTYTGEASLIEALRPSMVNHGIFMYVYNIKKIYRDQYSTKQGTAMVNTLIHAAVRFTHVSGEFIEVEATGEGADAGDKSANKALTGLYKYAMRQTFCIETGDDPDQFSSEAYERAEMSATVKNAPKQPQEATGRTETGELEETTQTSQKTAVEPSEKTYTGNQVMASTDLVGIVIKNTQKPAPVVCGFLTKMEKGKKFTLSQIESMISAEGVQQ